MNIRRWVLAAVAVAILAGGAYYYTASSGRAGAAQQAPRMRDAGLGVLLAIRTLEREPETRLSRGQVAKVLPFVKALKDVPASDTEAAAAIARSVRDTFTPQQHAALDAARREFQQRGASGGAGSGEGVGDGAASAARSEGGQRRGGNRAPGASRGGALSDEQRNDFRTRSFERMIRYLERRMES
jgi:hypothetical protein